jgi:SagB-type dehydrogenase family enzyme
MSILKKFTFTLIFCQFIFAAGCSKPLTATTTPGWLSPTTVEISQKNSLSGPEKVIDLPDPSFDGSRSVEAALVIRRSVREFLDDLLTLEEIGQLLWAAQGITGPTGKRTAPSAGALYPLEIYVATSEGVFHYDPIRHCLLVLMDEDARPSLYEAAVRQESVLSAPAVFIISAVFERTTQKYGEERGPGYVYMEAGHVAQNLLLQAVALNLGGVPIGAFYEERIKGFLELPDDHEPIYLVPIGRPLDQSD